jgi:uncharacterized RDD family membrane protein YckC
VSATNPYAPPQGAVRDLPAEGLELAGRGSRLLACIVDTLIGGVMIYLPAFALMAANGTFAELEQPADQFDLGVLGVPIFLCVMGFIAWAWITTLLVARYGQTMGKRILEIKVVRSDGSQASLGRIFWLRNVVNYLLGVIPFYGLIDVLFIFGVRRQCLHDLIADTIVVRA